MNKAYLNGRSLEKEVEYLLKIEQGHHKISDAKSFDDLRSIGEPCFKPQFANCFEGSHGEQSRVDNLIYHPEKWPNGLIIQCKAQSVSGSALDKLDKTILDLRFYSPYPGIIVTNHGYKKLEKISSLLRQNMIGGNFLTVMDVKEFMRDWLSKGRL